MRQKKKEKNRRKKKQIKMRLAILVLAIAVASTSALTLFDQTLTPVWEEFKATHGKQYATSQEESYRRMIFERNHKKISTHNDEFAAGLHTFTQKMNKFGDMTNQEFRQQMNGYDSTIEKARPEYVYQSTNAQIPDSVDWRTQGYVTPIKDQGQCGSCWAFSAIASLEGQHFKASQKLVSLSEQNLVDCSRKQGNQGCDGGLMDQAFTYIKVNKGIDTEASYPYKAVDQKCKFNAANVGATDTGFVDITSGSEDDLTNAIATIGPISVAIDASQDSFQFYSSGVYYEPGCSSTELDHGVTAVGYGAQGSKLYYIVKNSWGTSWGQQGYILMSRNKKNNCGIATASSYPLV